jgi:hypothetical protein
MESRYGTCALFFARAWTTLPNVKRLVLMFVASLNRTPRDCVFFTRSLPAISTTVSRPRCWTSSTFPVPSATAAESSRGTRFTWS